MTTEQPSVPAEPSEPGILVPPPPPHGTGVADRRGRRLRIGGWVLVPLLLAAFAAAFFVPIPYYEIRPGSARSTAPLVRVEGTQTYDSEGSINFTTVSLRQATLATALTGWFDGDVDVYSREEIFGDQTASENRQQNLVMMDTSKQTAITEGLLHLGYEVPVKITGEVVAAVLPGGAAEGKLQQYDTILAIDGERLTMAGDLSRIMAGKRPGDVVRLTYESPARDGEKVVDIELGSDERVGERGVIGVSVQPREPDYQFPFPIDIDSGSVGGPSAGLAFTLGVIDALTPGDLTGGRRVAVTGTINPGGGVGIVGGVPQKAAVVEREDMDVFIVPRAERALAESRVGPHVEVIPVDTLKEALDALARLGGSGLALGTGADGRPG